MCLKKFRALHFYVKRLQTYFQFATVERSANMELTCRGPARRPPVSAPRSCPWPGRPGRAPGWRARCAWWATWRRRAASCRRPPSSRTAAAPPRRGLGVQRHGVIPGSRAAKQPKASFVVKVRRATGTARAPVTSHARTHRWGCGGPARVPLPAAPSSAAPAPRWAPGTRRGAGRPGRPPQPPPPRPPRRPGRAGQRRRGPRPGA